MKDASDRVIIIDDAIELVDDEGEATTDSEVSAAPPPPPAASPPPAPVAEACDGRDNNCSGAVDEGCPAGVNTAAGGVSPRDYGSASVV